MKRGSEIPRRTLLTPLVEAELLIPPMQKLFVAGNILPGTGLSPDKLEEFVDGLSEVTGMNLFGAVQIKTPDHYDVQTFADLGRPPQDVNVSWMWDDSGGQMYIFPNQAHWTTIDLHTCKEFDSRKALGYIACFLNFRENMRYSEQTRQDNRQWQVYEDVQTPPETPFIEELTEILNIDSQATEQAMLAGSRLEAIVSQATSEGWGDRLASLFTEPQREKMREVHSAFEIGVDGAFMNGVIAGRFTDASDYPFQATYDRLATMEVRAAKLSCSNKVMHIGTGWPGTAIGVYRQNGNPVTCIERDPEVAAKSRLALERLGLYGKGKITVVNMDGCEVYPEYRSTVIISAMVPNKDKLTIFENIRDVTIDTGDNQVLLRQPSTRAHSLFYQPLPAELIPTGWVVQVDETRPGANDPLRSTVLQIRRRTIIGRGYGTFAEAASARLRRAVAA